MKRLYFIFSLLITAWITASAYDFIEHGIAYKKHSDGKSVYVTYINFSRPYYEGSIVIPSTVTYSGTTYPITSIGEMAFYNCSGLKSITIPNSVTSIGEWAFSYCSGLTSVTIPNSVTSIGDGAFSNSGLTSITIPNSVTSIGNKAFYETAWYYNQPDGLVYAGLVAYKYKGTIPSNTSITLKDGTKGIGDYAFDDCKGLTSITIPNSVTSIGDYAFDDCKGLTSITIGNSVTSIGYCAFYGCSGLTGSLTIPNSVTSIGGGAFFRCTGLTSVTIPNSVTSIGEWAFSECSGLTSVEYNAVNCSSPSSSSDTWFEDSPLTSLIIGDKVKTIPAYLACDQTKLTSITIPNSVTSIEQYAFSGCSGLTSVEYNAVNCSSPSSSSYTWFKDCPLTSLIIGDEVETIPDYFAYNQNNLTSITIPDFVTFIGSSAFYGCTGLTSVTIGNSVTSIGEGAFSECTGLTSVEYNAINCADPTAYSYAWFKNSTLTSLKIGDKVKRIPAYLAFNQKNLSGITIPDSVTFIGSSAFYGCTGLKSITIPNSVTSIGNEAFYECSGLTSIKVDAGNAYYDSRNNCNAIIETKSNSLIKGCMNTIIPNSVTSIGSSAFNYCSGLTSINIPNSVTSIGEWAFSECSGLTSVAIPNSVTYIGDGAFSNCSELLDIYTKYMDPIAIPSSTFEGNTYTNTYTTAILHVPEGCIQYYRAKDYWNKFSIIRDDNGKPGDAVTGDLNDDGVVDIADVNAVIDMILGLQDATTVGDVNGDGNVDVADMNAIINIILGL